MEKYMVKVKVSFSTLVEIEADTVEEAEGIVTEDYYNGMIMEELSGNEYCDGLEEVSVIDICEEDDTRVLDDEED